MKVNWNRKYTTVAVYSLIVIAVAVLFVVFVFKFDDFTKGFSWVGEVAAPVIAGVSIAYILNPLMMYLENRLFGKLKKEPPSKENIVMRKLHSSSVGDSKVVKELEKHSAPISKKVRRRRAVARIFSLILTYIIVFAVLAGIIVAVAPSVAKSIVDLADQLPGYIDQAEVYLNDFFANNPEISNFLFEEFTDLSKEIKNLAATLKPMAGDILGNVGSGLWSMVSAVLVALKNVLLGFIIAIYLLYSKERLLAQCRKVLFALLNKERSKTLFDALGKSNDIFKKYIISNLVDSMLIFVLMLIGMFAMGMPYPTLISAVCGVTNLIPFFGPFIGAIPCAVFILLADPVKVIWFALFVLILQQCDGNIIKPFLFGETIGVPAIWVLVSIIVGGGMFGIPGMLLGVPVFAVIYTLFAEFINGKLKKKNLPDETELYAVNAGEFAQRYIDAPPEGDPPPEAQAPEPQPAPQPAPKAPAGNSPRRKSGGAKRK